MKTLINILKGGVITVIASIAYLAGGYIVPLVAGIMAWIDNSYVRAYAPSIIEAPTNSYDMLVSNIWFFGQDLITMVLVCGIPVCAAYYIAARLSIALKTPPAYSIFPLSFLMLGPVLFGIAAVVISIGTLDAYRMFFLVLGQITRIAVVLYCFFTFPAWTRSQIS